MNAIMYHSLEGLKAELNVDERTALFDCIGLVRNRGMRSSRPRDKCAKGVEGKGALVRSFSTEEQSRH